MGLKKCLLAYFLFFIFRSLEELPGQRGCSRGLEIMFNSSLSYFVFHVFVSQKKMVGTEVD